MRNNCPCKGCVPPLRQIGCHGKCQKYIDWHKDQMAQSEQERKEKFVTVQLMDMTIQGKEKARKQHRRRRRKS